jgi:hypothetical protein
MRAREYPSGLIRAASKAPDLKVARSLPGGRVFGKMTTVHVLILPMRRESLERSHRCLRRVLQKGLRPSCLVSTVRCAGYRVTIEVPVRANVLVGRVEGETVTLWK